MKVYRKIIELGSQDTLLNLARRSLTEFPSAVTTNGWKLMEGAAPSMTPISFATISSAGLRVRQSITSFIEGYHFGDRRLDKNFRAGTDW